MPRYYEMVLFVGNNRGAREAAVRGYLDAVVTPNNRADGVHEVRTAADWPFRREVTPPASESSIRDGHVWIRDLHDAFPDAQTAGTRLVLTQGTYQIERWHAWHDAHHPVRVVADAHASILRAEPVMQGRGAWRRCEVRFVAPDGGVALLAALPGDVIGEAPPPQAMTPLQTAFRQPDPELRRAEAVRAAAGDPGNAALLLCAASCCMEMARLDEAHDALERALAIAPDWEAAHFEHGKLWLRADDTERAAAAFAEAGRLMPSFSTAFVNLGAALGEQGRHDEALDALLHAREYDPRSHTLHNNLGVVYRELGRLGEAEEAFRQALDRKEDFVFGRYNLGHALFLQGRFRDAVAQYEAGMTRDPQKNARQACRLAIARAAAGDPSGALTDLEALAGRVPADAMRMLMEEAESTLVVLSAIEGVDSEGVVRVLSEVRRYSS